ncbi:hypothetical protein [Bradyrhizobium sp. CSA207]|uniref:hypothetical protein n=1 Tax=Bradyrhizobium sp. CSA207 TaxID=2698826 RepID=UPI0023AEF8A0|nr:hypothetical protein [Bradyrhizobium sp. CSA207]
MGAEVTVLTVQFPQLGELDDLFEGRVRTGFSTIESVEEVVFALNVVIGTSCLSRRERAEICQPRAC